ncbi:hypothetical protein [Zoogloea sp.]|uniref:hypothetical protein n=1 Tax=Zoogloea sp. TaxID=49181 RepID=UPI0037D9E8CC
MEKIVVQPMQWSSAKDIHQVERLSYKDSECLREIRDVLVKHGALDRFGVSLLHSHFPVESDEYLLETVDVENRSLLIRPVKKLEVSAAIQTQWRLSDCEAVQICHGWCQYSGGTHNHGHDWLPSTPS